jgi:DHA1 family bicyclomycin/chloramphenicol resistance-like MFS transporter
MQDSARSGARIIGRAGEQHTLAVVLFGTTIFALLPISTDLYLPALPALRTAFGDSGALAQLTLSAFVVGFGLAHLVTGPLSDRFGRRPLLLAGLSLYFMASLGCALAADLTMLIAFRFLQGVGCCSGSVMSRAIIRDLYEPRRGAHVFSLITIAFTAVPMLAPVIGGALTAQFGWRANFLGLLGYAAFALAATWWLLAETNRHRDPLATDPVRLAGNFALIARDTTFRTFTLCGMFSYMGLFTYLSLSPFVLVEAFGVAPEHFGYWFMAGVVGHACGALSCSRLVRHIPLQRLLVLSAAITTTGAVAMLGLAVAGVAHPLGVIGPMFVYLMGHGITSPLCMTGAVGPFPKLAGTASALFGFIQAAVAAMVGQLAMQFYDGTALPLAVTVTVAALCLAAAALLAMPRPAPSHGGRADLDR